MEESRPHLEGDTHRTIQALARNNTDSKKKFGQEMPIQLNSTVIIDPVHDLDCNK